MSRLGSALGAVALVGTALVPLALAAAVAPASATTLNVQAVPGTRVLNEVACPTATTCVAVGQFDDATGSHGVVVPITNGVPGASQVVVGTATLTGVACSDATTCVAVGSVTQVNRAQNAVVVPIVNGVAGAVQTIPNAEALNSVACSSATSCVAVGGSSFQGVVVPIANGVAGAAQFVTNDDGGLTGVACYGPTACVAVGNNFPLFESDGVVVLISNGTAGTSQLVTSTSTLNRVACRVSICEATGAAQSPPFAAVLQITNGVPGAPQVVPPLAPSGVNTLLGIACPSDTLCEAVGNADTGVLVAVHSGVPAAPKPVPGTAGLNGIACTTASTCIAVGTNSDGTEGAIVSIGAGAGSTLECTPGTTGGGQPVMRCAATAPLGLRSIRVVAASGRSLSAVSAQSCSSGSTSGTITFPTSTNARYKVTITDCEKPGAQDIYLVRPDGTVTLTRSLG